MVKVEDKRILLTFFRTVAIHYGFYDKTTKSLRAGVENEPVFLKNLELLQSLPKATKGLVESKCRTALRNNIKCNWITELDLSSELDPNKNIIDGSTVFLHHQLLKIDTPPTRLQFGSACSIEAEESPTVYKVESYTIKQLLDYFCGLFMLSPNKDNSKAWLGALDYLLKQYSVDVLLFAMDAAAEADANLYNPLMLDTYLPSALEYIQEMRGRAYGDNIT